MSTDNKYPISERDKFLIMDPVVQEALRNLQRFPVESAKGWDAYPLRLVQLLVSFASERRFHGDYRGEFIQCLELDPIPVTALLGAFLAADEKIREWARSPQTAPRVFQASLFVALTGYQIPWTDVAVSINKELGLPRDRLTDGDTLRKEASKFISAYSEWEDEMLALPQKLKNG